MGYPSAIDITAADPSAREAYLDGVKAAFVASQFNRFGQVLCSACGRGWDDFAAAFSDLRVHQVSQHPGFTAPGRLGADHPNNLALVCARCL